MYTVALKKKIIKRQLEAFAIKRKMMISINVEGPTDFIADTCWGELFPLLMELDRRQSCCHNSTELFVCLLSLQLLLLLKQFLEYVSSNTCQRNNISLSLCTSTLRTFLRTNTNKILPNKP